MALKEIKHVWNIHLRVRLPQADNDNGGVISSAWLLAAYPLIGFVAGIGLVAVGWLINQIIPRAVAAGFIGGLALPLLLLWFVKVQAFVAISSYSNRLTATVAADNEESASAMRHLLSLIPTAWLILTMAGAGVLVYDRAYLWLLFAPVPVFAAYAESLLRAGAFNAIEDNPAKPASTHWYAAFAIGLILVLFGAALAPVLLGILASWFIVSGANRLVRRLSGKADVADLTFALSELAILWTGVLRW